MEDAMLISAKRMSALVLVVMLVSTAWISAAGQSLGNAGTIKGTVLDPSGAAVPGAVISVRNPVTGYSQETTSAADGTFQLSNLPPNPYHLEVQAKGFAVFTQDVAVRGSLPVQLTAKLAVEGSSTTVNVEAAGADLVELDPTAHVDTDRNQFTKIPELDPAGGLSQAIIFSTGGVAAGSIGLGWGNDKVGNFLAIDGVRSGRFLDTPEFLPIHDIGNSESFFDRVDYQVTPNDIVHLNLFAARNWFQIPNSLDQLPQDERQKVVTWSIAPGYQHSFSSKKLLTVNPYIRKDQLEYFPSPNPFDDTPATQSQNR